MGRDGPAAVRDAHPAASVMEHGGGEKGQVGRIMASGFVGGGDGERGHVGDDAEAVVWLDGVGGFPGRTHHEGGDLGGYREDDEEKDGWVEDGMHAWAGGLESVHWHMVEMRKKMIRIEDVGSMMMNSKRPLPQIQRLKRIACNNQ